MTFAFLRIILAGNASTSATTMKLRDLKSPQHLAWIIPTVIGLLVYLSTMCRTVYVGDSGEFSLDFKTLGIAHPPGYPLFTLLGRVFLMLTAFLKPALSANLLAVLLAAAVIPALYFLLLRVNGGNDQQQRPWLIGILMLLWAFSSLFWGETVAVEVYGLNLLFVVLILSLIFSNLEYKWYLLAYLLGLALAHHPTALSILPVVLYAYYQEWRTERKRSIPFCLALFFVGLSVYLYLPTRASVNPLADWGHPANLGLFSNHITALQYQHAAAFSISNLTESLKLFLTLLLQDWWWIGLLLMMLGVWVGIQRQDRCTIYALILLISNLLLVSFYRIPDLDSYYLPGLLAAFLLMCQAIFYLAERLPVKNGPVWLLTVGVFSVLLLLILNYARMNRSDDRLTYDYGRLILDTAVSGTVFTRDDNASFASLYLRYAENYRPQVEVFDQAVRLKALYDQVDRMTGFSISDYGSARDIFLQKASGKKWLVKCHFPYDDEWYQVKSPLFSAGILYSTSAVPTTAQIPTYSFKSLPDDFKSRQMLVNLELCRAEDALKKIPKLKDQADEAVGKAQNYFEDEPRGTLHNQLGIAMRHLGLFETAIACYQKGLESSRLSLSERQEIIYNISNIHKDLGNQFATAGEYQKAVNAYAKALEYDPNNPKLLYNIGVIYINYLKRPERGIPYLETYLQYKPDDESVRQLVEANRIK